MARPLRNTQPEFALRLEELARNVGDLRREVRSSDNSGGAAVWGGITGTLSAQTDLGVALNSKQAVGNYQAANPVLTNTTASFTTALEAKLSGVATGATANSTDAILLSRDNHTGTQFIATVTGLQGALDGKETVIAVGTTAQYYRGDKTFQTLDKAAVGLANVNNTSDANKPISNATQSALDGKQAAGSYQPLAAVLTNTTASFTTAQESKLAGISPGATANSSDAQLRDRSTHTGTQAVGTITGLGTLATQSGTFSGTSSGTNTGDQTSVSGNAGTATALQTGRSIAMTGDVTWTIPSFNGTGNVTAAGTLATVNANVGTFGSGSLVPVLTVNAKGLITAVSTEAVAGGGGATSTVVAGRTYRATNQSIPAGAGFTLVEFSTVGMAVGGTFFNPAFPSELIITEDGVWDIFFEGTGEGTVSTVTWDIQVNLVGGGIIGASQYMAAASAVAQLDNRSARQYTAGQKITVGIKHSNATPLNLLNEGNHSPDILMIKVGGAKGDTGSAGAASGATTQVQYNNAGAFAGDPDFAWDASANSLILDGTDTSITLQSITNEPAAPSAGRIKLYAKSYAGKMLPKIKGPSSLDFPLQIALWGSKIYRWQSTNATAGVWEGTVGAGAGAFSRALPTVTSQYTSIARARYANAATTLNQVLGQRNTEAVFFRGSVAGRGGFFFFARLGFDVWTNGGRFFAGMHTATTVVSGDPSALNNTVGFCVDAADNGAISFLTRGTAATKAATGFTAVSGKGYDVYIFCAPNSAQYQWRIVDINTQVVATGVATLTLPTNTVMMTAGVLASNAALTAVTAVQLGCDMIYAETDY